MSAIRLNLTYEHSTIETDLDEMDIRSLIINNKRKLGLIYFDESRSPYSYFIIIDGITTEDQQYRLTINIINKNIYRELEITACGSGSIDRIKAKLFNQKEILYSIEASRYAKDVILTMLAQAEHQIGGY